MKTITYLFILLLSLSFVFSLPAPPEIPSSVFDSSNSAVPINKSADNTSLNNNNSFFGVYFLGAFLFILFVIVVYLVFIKKDKSLLSRKEVIKNNGK